MLEMVEAYSALDNSGVKVVPYSIRYISDNEGNVLWEAEDLEARSKRVLSEKEAYLMVEGMRNVFKYGTATNTATWENTQLVKRVLQIIQEQLVLRLYP